MAASDTLPSPSRPDTLALPWRHAVDGLIQQLQHVDTTALVATHVQLRQALPSTASALNLADWLASQPGHRKFYWRSRDGEHEVATLDIAQSLEGPDAETWLNSGRLATSALTYYWVSGFSTADKGWQDYPQQLLFLPQIELCRQDQQLWLCANLSQQTPPPVLINRLRQLHVGRIPPPQRLSLTSIAREDCPTRPGWTKMITQAQRQISQKGLLKVVLSRKTTLKSPTTLDFWALFRQWRQEAVNGYQMALQLGPHAGFIAFTPERLYRREHDQLVTEALAGTLPLNPTHKPPYKPAGIHRGQHSIATVDAKTRHEHALVVNDILDKLQPCVTRVARCGPIQLQPQRNLQHLYQPIKAQLKKTDCDGDLIRMLHPTAAVGGLPAEQALTLIRAQESFPRGWFAGCCGPLSAHKSELAVGIRSARVDADRLHLFAGAGIVQGSEAEMEWQELEQKIALPLSLFNAEGVRHATKQAPDKQTLQPMKSPPQSPPSRPGPQREQKRPHVSDSSPIA